MKGGKDVGLLIGIGGGKPKGDDSDGERRGAAGMALAKAIKEALSSKDGSGVIEALQEAMSCCDDAEEPEDDDAETMLGGRDDEL